MLKIINLSKNFGENKVLDNINFEVPEGTIFGLLGPNGAGKTTLLRIINRIYLANEGRILWKDIKISDEFIAKKTAYLPEERGLYPKMTVIDNIKYFAQIRGLKNDKNLDKKIREFMEDLSISDKNNVQLQKLSKGMQQKIQIIASLLHNPDLIMLDEPFSGLDPINSQKLKFILKDLAKKGKTVVFSSHRMEQVEELCQEIALINNGKVVLNGKVDQIKEKYKESVYYIKTKQNIDNIDINIKILEKLDNSIKFKLLENQDLNQTLRYFFDEYQILEFREIFPSIEEIFVKVVNKK